MRDESSRQHRWSNVSRLRNGFLAKNNPNLNFRPSEASNPPGSLAEFPTKTNPDYGKLPLTDEQKDLATEYLPLARSLAKQLHARWHVEPIRARSRMPRPQSLAAAC